MDERILKKAIVEVGKHKDVLDYDLKTRTAAFGIKTGDSSSKNLKKILIPAIQYRAGPGLNVKECKTILNEFDEKYPSIHRILINGNSQADMDTLVEEVDELFNIGPKIAGVFLKDVVFNFRIGERMIPYLYLPIDRHVRNIFVSKLQAISEDEMPMTSDKYSHYKNKPFQEGLSRIHDPRIDFDMFWYIGSNYCFNHLLCDVCWINKFCKKRVPYTL
jgi:endonuclease III